jgi:hypothetical protein
MSNIIKGYVLTRTFGGQGCVGLSGDCRWAPNQPPFVHSRESLEEILAAVEAPVWGERRPSTVQTAEFNKRTGAVTITSWPLQLVSLQNLSRAPDMQAQPLPDFRGNPVRVPQGLVAP